MRQQDADKHPKALEREQQAKVKFWAGMAVALVGVVIMFTDDQHYLGAVLAMVGTGIVPFKEAIQAFRK